MPKLLPPPGRVRVRAAGAAMAGGARGDAAAASTYVQLLPTLPGSARAFDTPKIRDACQPPVESLEHRKAWHTCVPLAPRQQRRRARRAAPSQRTPWRALTLAAPPCAARSAARAVLIKAGLRKELVESVTGFNTSQATMMTPHSVAVLVSTDADPSGHPMVLSAVAYQWHPSQGMAQVRAGADARAGRGSAARRGP